MVQVSSEALYLTKKQRAWLQINLLASICRTVGKAALRLTVHCNRDTRTSLLESLWTADMWMRLGTERGFDMCCSLYCMRQKEQHKSELQLKGSVLWPIKPTQTLFISQHPHCQQHFMDCKSEVQWGFCMGVFFEAMADAKGSRRQIKVDIIHRLFLFISLFSIHKLSQKKEKFFCEGTGWDECNTSIADCVIWMCTQLNVSWTNWNCHFFYIFFMKVI